MTWFWKILLKSVADDDVDVDVGEDKDDNLDEDKDDDGDKDNNDDDNHPIAHLLLINALPAHLEEEVKASKVPNSYWGILHKNFTLGYITYLCYILHWDVSHITISILYWGILDISTYIRS